MSVQLQSEEKAAVPSDEVIKISIIVPTCDRPASLRRCLTHLFAQETTHTYEVIVVDNRPEAQSAAAVIDDFPGTTLLEEHRAGSSYARNKGILYSKAELLVTIDDDVVVPTGWLEQLIAPFQRPEIWIVSGNILPLSLEQETEQLFETHCGLGQGDQAFEIDSEWFRNSKEAVRAWEFGVTANAAYRAALFEPDKVGLLEETLGAGTPVGGAEDPYLFYAALQAGYTLSYSPAAWAWHEHRQTRQALRSQLYGYSKSASAYHLMTLINHQDSRAIRELLLNLPRYYCKRLVFAVLGLSDYPADLAYTEFIGFWIGPWKLWRSHRRVGKLGRSLVPD